ncbi:MAG: 3-oxoadipate enol-lactonase [Pseudomonadota bacterium]
MDVLRLDDASLHYREDGAANGAPVVFSNSLGTDLRLWDKVVARMPSGFRLIRYDTRGHGLSSAPEGPYKMGTLVRDAELLMEHLEVRDAVFVGLSMGGMIAQGLAVKRLDLIRGVVLSNTGAKIGTPEMWQERIDAVRAGGIEAIADGAMERWFTRAFRDSHELALWRNMYVRQDPEGFCGAMAAISGTDMMAVTSGLRLPALGIAGSDDGSTPPDMVRELMGLIPGSGVEIIRKAGHLPCVEQPDKYTKHLLGFLSSIGHGTNG